MVGFDSGVNGSRCSPERAPTLPLVAIFGVAADLRVVEWNRKPNESPAQQIALTDHRVAVEKSLGLLVPGGGENKHLSRGGACADGLV